MKMGSSDWSDFFTASLKEFPDWGFSDSCSNLPASTGPSLYDDATADLYIPVESLSFGINSKFDAYKSDNSYNFDAGEIQTSASEEIASLLSCDYSEIFLPSNNFYNDESFLEQVKLERNISSPIGVNFLNLNKASFLSSTALAESISNEVAAKWFEKDNVEGIRNNQITQFASDSSNDGFHRENTLSANCTLNNRIETDHCDQHESLYKESPLLSTPNKFERYRSVKNLLDNERLDTEHPCLGFQAIQPSDYDQNSDPIFSSDASKENFLRGCLYDEANYVDPCLRDYAAGKAVSPSQFLYDFCTFPEKSIDHYNNNYLNVNETEDHSAALNDLVCKDGHVLPAVTSRGLPHETMEENSNDEQTSKHLILDGNNNKSQFTRSNIVRNLPPNNSTQNNYFYGNLSQLESLSTPTSERGLPTLSPKIINTASINSTEFDEICCKGTTGANMQPKIQTILLKRIKVKKKKKLTETLKKSCSETSEDRISSKNNQSDQSLHSDLSSDISSLCQTKDQDVRSVESTLTVGSSQSRKKNLNKETRWQPILPALPKNHMRTNSMTPITFIINQQQPIINHLMPVTVPSIPISNSNEHNPSVSGTSAAKAAGQSVKSQQPQLRPTSFTSSGHPYTLLRLHSGDSANVRLKETIHSRTAGSGSSNQGNTKYTSRTLNGVHLQCGSDRIKTSDDLSGKNKSHYFSSLCNRRTRPSFSVLQLKILQRRFERSQYVPKHEIGELANLLELSQLQVKMWFQNRRSKYKKLLRRAMDQNHAKRKDIAAETSATLSVRAPNSPPLMTRPVQKSYLNVGVLKIQPKTKNSSKLRMFEDLEDNLTLRNKTAPTHPNSYGK